MHKCPLLGPVASCPSLSRYSLSSSSLSLSPPAGLSVPRGFHRYSPSPEVGCSLALHPAAVNRTKNDNSVDMYSIGGCRPGHTRAKPG